MSILFGAFFEFQTLFISILSLHSEEPEEPELNSHQSAVVKTMIKGPVAIQGKQSVCVYHF